MAEGVSKDQFKYVLDLLVQVGVINADQAKTAIKNVGDSVKDTDQKMGKWQATITTVNSALGQMGQVVGKVGAVFGAEGLSIGNAVSIHYKYNQAITTTYNQMQKFGYTVQNYEGLITKLRSSYKGTYEQTIQLAAAFEKGFSFTGPQKMAGILSSVRDVTGNNVEAMASFVGELQGIASANPLFEKLLNNFDTDVIAERNKDIKSFALDMALAGKLSDQQIKALQVFVNGRPKDKESSDRLDAMNSENLAVRKIRNEWENINMEVGNKLAPYLVQIGDYLEKHSALVTAIGAGFMVVSAGVGLISGGLSTALAMGTRLAELKKLWQTQSAVGQAVSAGGKYAGFGQMAGTGLRAGAGGLAAWGAGSLYDNFAGARHEGYSDDSYFGGVANELGRTGTQIGAGAAVGGVPGAIAGGALNLASSIPEVFKREWDIGKNVGGNLMEESRQRSAVNRVDGNGIKFELAKQSQKVADADHWWVSSKTLETEKQKLVVLTEQYHQSSEFGETLKRNKAYEDQVTTAITEQVKKQEQETKTTKDMADFLIRVNQEMKSYNQQLEIASTLTRTSNELLKARANLIGASGGSAIGVQDEASKAKARLESEMSINAQIIQRTRALQEEGESKFGSGKNISAGERAAAEKVREDALASLSPDDTSAGEKYSKIMNDYFSKVGYSADYTAAKIDQLTTSQTEKYKKLADINIEVAETNKPQIETQEKINSALEAQISLVDSAGMGLKAQVGARKQLMDQIGQEIGLLNEQASLFQQALRDAQQKEKFAKSEEEARQARAEERQYGNKLLDLDVKRTQLMQKQAEISKSMREGWISAISAMTTGAGVFTRIVIDQNKRLGNLQFAAPDRLATLRGGGILGGRSESAQWSPGGFREGAAGGYEKNVLSKYGMAPGNTIQDMAKGVMNYQTTVGSQMSPAAATINVGPQGTAEITTAITEGFAKAGEKQKEASRSSTQSFMFDKSQIDEIKKSLTDALVAAAKEAKAAAIKEINSGR